MIEKIIATPFILLFTFPISFSIIKVLNDSFKEVEKEGNANKEDFVNSNHSNNTKKVGFFKVMFILGVILIVIVVSTLIYSGPLSFSH